ncbi:MAG: GxxExxY protein [Actinomycetota bacterium]
MEPSKRAAAMAVATLHYELTEKVIGCAFRVYNRMGYGFVESVYEKCLVIELRRSGLEVEVQKPINVYYEGEMVGEFVADLFVNDSLLVELKSIRTLAPANEVQLVNYLVATGVEIGLLVNFGEAGVEVKRKLRVLPQRPRAKPAASDSGSVQAPNPINPVHPV